MRIGPKTLVYGAHTTLRERKYLLERANTLHGYLQRHYGHLFTGIRLTQSPGSEAVYFTFFFPRFIGRPITVSFRNHGVFTDKSQVDLNILLYMFDTWREARWFFLEEVLPLILSHKQLKNKVVDSSTKQLVPIPQLRERYSKYTN